MNLLLVFMLITNPFNTTEPALTADISNPTKNHECSDGAIDLHINSGFAPYDVTWKRVIYNYPYPPSYFPIQSNTGISGNNDGEDLSNLIPGIYIVEVTDALCGTIQKEFKLRCECSDDCTLEADVQPATCGNNGSIVANLTCLESGHVPFTGKWSDLPNYQHQTLSRTDLKSGYYCLTVTDKNGCTYKNCWEVEGPNINVSVNLLEQENSSLCNSASNSCDGSLTISVTPPGTSFEWQNIPNPNEIFSNTVTDLCPGVYTVEAFLNNCLITESYTIGCCVVSNGSSTEVTPPISVSGVANSRYRNIVLNVVGGGDLSFLWTGPNGFVSDQMDIGNLEPGQYCVKVFDGCTEDEECFTIVDCAINPIQISATLENTCDELAVGNIILNITGGHPPYQALWNNGGQGGSSIYDLPSGEYCVIVTDKYGCNNSQECFTISSQTGEESASSTPCVKYITCNGERYEFPFEYQITWDCNLKKSFCPATGETQEKQLDYIEKYFKNCDQYGICQSGVHRLLIDGDVVEPPFEPPIEVRWDASCAGSGIRCFNTACYYRYQNEYTHNDSDFGYCATLSLPYWNYNNNCGKLNLCTIDVYCGGEKTDHICGNRREEDCLITFQEYDDPIIILDEENIQPSNFLDDLDDSNTVRYRSNDIVNDNIAKNDSNITANWDLIVYPSPTNDVIKIESRDGLNIDIIVSIIDVYGSINYTENILFSEFNKSADIDLSYFAPGIYFIQFEDTARRRIVKRVLKI